MERTTLVTKLSRFLGYRSILKEDSFRKEFFREVGLINFNRLRIFGYFLSIFSLSQLYNDFFVSSYWDDRQIGAFMVLDIILGAMALWLVIITHYKRPRHKDQIKKWHRVSTYIYFFIHVQWATAISLIEVSSTNGLTTYLIGIFAASTVFLIQSLPIVITFIISLTFMYGGLYFTEVPIEIIATKYVQIPPLVVVAWIVSRVLMNTRMRSFAYQKEVEMARDNLDLMVKERTIELEEANLHLTEEIKERKKYERGLKREKKKAEDADQLKSIFLANMSHEIRTPLNGILGFGDLLETPNLTDSKRSRYISIIKNNGQQLLKIIDDIMDISMIESNQLKMNIIPFRMKHLFPQALEFFTQHKHSTNKDHLKLINDGFPEPDGQTMDSDPIRIQQVLYNLLSNAVKFTHEGEIRFGGHVHDNYALVYVEDTGIGVTPEQSTSIFERFRQGQESTSREYGGTGLGLSISKGIIELLNGLIWIDLSYTHGSRFCFSINTGCESGQTRITDLKTQWASLNGNCLLVSDQNEASPQFLDFFINYWGMNLKRYHFEDSDVDSLAKKSSILVLELSETNKISEKVEQLIRDSNNSYIIALLPNKAITGDKLLKAGCTKVYHTPINALELFNDIYSFTEQSNTIPAANS